MVPGRKPRVRRLQPGTSLRGHDAVVISHDVVVNAGAPHVDSAGVAADARPAYPAWNMHSMETPNVASTKSPPMTASTTRLRIGYKHTAGQCGSHQENHNPF